MSAYRAKGEVLPAQFRAQLSQELATDSDEAFASRIGISRTALLRAAAGAPIWPCTRIAVMSYLDSAS